MSIDHKAGGPSRGWCVRVDVSVLEHVPRDVLAAWMAIESFANASGASWPENVTLARRMGVGSVRAARRALLKLVEYGILERIDLGGNHRQLQLRRRTSQPITAAEWAVLMERGEARVQTRQGGDVDVLPGTGSLRGDH